MVYHNRAERATQASYKPPSTKANMALLRGYSSLCLALLAILISRVIYKKASKHKRGPAEVVVASNSCCCSKYRPPWCTIMLHWAPSVMLKVQSIQTWFTHGFYARNRRSRFGSTHSIWVRTWTPLRCGFLNQWVPGGSGGGFGRKKSGVEDSFAARRSGHEGAAFTQRHKGSYFPGNVL